MTDYGDLSTTELAKQINDEYVVILESERTNLQKAMAIGEKLLALRPRIAPDHGDWQAKLKLYCPQISYETATRYIQLWKKREDLEKAAAAKSVVTTDLTIEEARKLIAKPTAKSADKSSKPKAVVKGGVEPGNEPKPLPSGPPDEIVKNLELDGGDMFEALKRAYGKDDLLIITERLAAYLGKTLVDTPPPKPDPLDIPPALQRPAPPADASAGAPARRISSMAQAG